MAARVEVLIGQRFNVLNRITWQKPPYATKAEMFRKEDLRMFFPASEAIIFAEHFNSDNYAQDGSGYDAECDKLRGFVFEPLRAYLDGERIRAGVSRDDINEALGFRRAGGMAKKASALFRDWSGHWFEKTQWTLPTLEEHYNKMRLCSTLATPESIPANTSGGSTKTSGGSTKTSGDHSL
jgi:adenine-specific DNA-methyltransferase